MTERRLSHLTLVTPENQARLIAQPQVELQPHVDVASDFDVSDILPSPKMKMRLLKIDNNLLQLESVYYSFSFIKNDIINTMLSLTPKTIDTVKEVEDALLDLLNVYLPEFSSQAEREYTAERGDDMRYTVVLSEPSVASITPIGPFVR